MADSVIDEQPAPQSNLERLGDSVNAVFEAINNLSHYGVDVMIGLSVPQIVLVGDQSAGKSSLVEALSQIQVPRDAGTCTRCPMEITTERADGDWSAEISISKTHSFDPGCDQEGNDFWPWIANAGASSLIPFKTVEHKEDLEEALRQAQRAILTPGRHAAEFLTNDGMQDIRGLKPFSPNKVVVKIRGPGLPSLSFVDLPGVISQSDEGGKRMVDLVKDLARSYVRQENTLVLLACSMENDIMNSSASALINEEEANARCVGVLTKPDRMARGDDDSAMQWIEVLNGSKFQRGYGYYVTKQPGQQGLKTSSHDEARKQEAGFFASSAWTDLFPGYESRLGTNKLASALSEHLVTLILEKLPLIRQQVREKLIDIEDRLQHMPEPPANPFHEVHRIIRELGIAVQAMVSYNPATNTIRQFCDEALLQFQKTVLEMLRPKFLPHAGLELKRKAKSDVIEPSVRQASTTPKKARAGTIVKDEPSGSSSTTMSQPSTPKALRTSFAGSPRKQEAGGGATLIAFTCAALKAELDLYAGSSLPGEVNPEALNKLILSTLQHWENPILQLLQSIGRGVQQQLYQAVGRSDICGGFGGSLLAKHLETFSSNFVRAAIVAEKEDAIKAAQREGLRPTILNQKSFDAEKDAELALLRDMRYTRRAQIFVDSIGIDLDLDEEDDKKKFDTLVAKKYSKEFGPDPFEREVEVMAKIRAYYRVASTRLAENVAMMIEAGVLRKLSNIAQQLEHSLDLYGGQNQMHWAAMLEQDPRIAEERLLLVGQATALQAAYDKLEQITGFEGHVDEVMMDGAV